jgi:hypothetical protein
MTKAAATAKVTLCLFTGPPCRIVSLLLETSDFEVQVHTPDMVFVAGTRGSSFGGCNAQLRLIEFHDGAQAKIVTGCREFQRACSLLNQLGGLLKAAERIVERQPGVLYVTRQVDLKSAKLSLLGLGAKICLTTPRTEETTVKDGNLEIDANRTVVWVEARVARAEEATNSDRGERRELLAPLDFGRGTRGFQAPPCGRDLGPTIQRFADEHINTGTDVGRHGLLFEAERSIVGRSQRRGQIHHCEPPHVLGLEERQLSFGHGNLGESQIEGRAEIALDEGGYLFENQAARRHGLKGDAVSRRG